MGESTRGVSIGDENLTKALYLKLRVQQMIEAEQAKEREERAKQREVAWARRRSITNDWMVVFFIAVLCGSGFVRSSPED